MHWSFLYLIDEYKLHLYLSNLVLCYPSNSTILNLPSILVSGCTSLVLNNNLNNKSAADELAY